jgi:endonuclease/exonuclease/phosphatase family metal-dependent hydrolase
MVEAGIARAKSSSGSTVLIGPGKYYETFTADVPCTLTATGGTVTIGKLDYQASTALDIITLNTHLAGDQLGMPSWEDKARAYDIAHFFGGSNPRPDVVGFQEIWDTDLFFGGDGTAGILPMSGYPYGKHGWYPCLVMEPVPSGCRGANSGLAVMSKHPLTDFTQHSFGVFCSGVDCLANKSWVQATIVKDGFHIGLFILHTQADSDPLAVEKRKWQIAMFASAILAFRVAHPNHVVFAFGDFNVFGEIPEYPEYITTLIPLIGNAAGGRDGHRNSPGFAIECSFTDCLSTDCSRGACLCQWTSSNCNDLAKHFDTGSEARLDYIFYFPSWDGSVEVIPPEVRVIPFRGRNHCCIQVPFPPFVICREDMTRICVDVPNTSHEICLDSFCTTESSDHWSVYGQFKLIRR